MRGLGATGELLPDRRDPYRREGYAPPILRVLHEVNSSAFVDLLAQEQKVQHQSIGRPDPSTSGAGQVRKSPSVFVAVSHRPWAPWQVASRRPRAARRASQDLVEKAFLGELCKG